MEPANTLSESGAFIDVPIDLFQEPAQISGHRHRLHGAHAGPAGVSNRNPDAREEARSKHSRQLPEYFASIAERDAELQHPPVDVHVPQGVPLAQDVRAFETLKGAIAVALRNGRGGAA